METLYAQMSIHTKDSHRQDLEAQGFWCLQAFCLQHKDGYRQPCYRTADGVLAHWLEFD